MLRKMLLLVGCCLLFLSPVFAEVKIFDRTSTFGHNNDLHRRFEVFLTGSYFTDLQNKLWVRDTVSIRVVNSGDHSGNLGVSLQGSSRSTGNAGYANPTFTFQVSSGSITSWITCSSDDAGWGPFERDDSFSDYATTFYSDTSGPVFSLASSASPWLADTNTTITISGFSDADSGLPASPFRYVFDAGTQVEVVDSVPGGDITFDLSTLTVGLHTLEVTGTDNVGNITKKSLAFEVLANRPTLSFSNFTGSAWSRNASIGVSASHSGLSGLTSLKVFKQGSPDTEVADLVATPTTTYDFPSSGTYYFVATSGAGVSTTSGDYLVQIDPNAPAVSISTVTVPAAGPVNGYYKSYNVTATGADGESQIQKIEYTLDGGATWAAGSSLVFANNAGGTFQFRATDEAGNQGASAQVTVATDGTGPSLSVGSVPVLQEGNTNASSVVLSLTGTDAKSGFNSAATLYRLGTGPVMTGASATLTAEGSHQVVFTGYDRLGNESSSTIQVRIDRTQPAISTLQAKRPDGTGLTATVGSSSATVKLFLAGNDSESGLKTYELWTVPGTVSTVPATLPAHYKSYSVPGAGLPTSIDFDTGDITQVNGTLVDGQTRTVVMRLTDKAGNAVFQKTSFLVKVTATPAPNAASLVRSWTGRQLNLSWSAVPTATGYQVSWLESGVAKSSTVTTPNFSLNTSDLTKYPGNVAVTFQVKSLDAAANLSAEASQKTIYMLPALGTLGAAVPGYSLTQGNRVAFSYSGGSSGTFRLVREGSVPVKTSLLTGAFLDTQLTSHANYSYHLEAESSDGGLFEGPSFPYTVPNQPPVAPVLSSPVTNGWVGPESWFTWAASSDSDGDVLSYSVFVKKTSDSNYGSALVTDLSELTTPVGSSLINGTAYQWKVVVADAYGGSASRSGTFTYDSVRPSVSWVVDPEGLGGYSGGAALVVNGSDTGGSGVGSAVQKVYQRAQSAGSIWTELTTTTLSNSATSWSLPWPTSSGLYKMEFRLTDRAGNQRTLETPAMLVDRQAPVLSSGSLEAPVSLGRKALSQGKVFFTGLSAQEPTGTAFSGISKLEAQFVSTTGVAVGAWQAFKATDGSKDTRNYSWGKASKAVDVPAGAYRLNFRVTDRAGNQTTVLDPQEYWIDTTPPVVSFKLGGLVLSGHRAYLSSASGLAVSALNVSDDESPLVGTKYAIVAAAEKPATWYTWADAKSAAGFTGGTAYRVWVQVTNVALGITEASSPEFVYDSTPPAQPTVSVDQGAVWAGDSVRVAAQAQDNESLIEDYQIEIGTAADPELLGIWHLSAGRPNMTVVIPEAVAGNYIVRLKAFGGNGLYASAETPLVINSPESRPSVSITDNGPFSTVVKATMTSPSPNLDFFEYRLVQDQVPESSWSALGVGVNTLVLENGLSDGSVYQVEVRGVLSGGERTESRTSSGVTIDQGQPTWNLAEGPVFGDGRSVSLNWNLVATPSGVARVSLVAARGAVIDRLDLTPAAQSSRYLVGTESLGLPDGALVNLTLEVENQAGTVVQKPLVPMVVDRSAPAAAVVGDQGSFHNGKQNLEAQWVASVSDAQSGTTYSWVLTKNPQNLDQVVWNPDQGTRRASVDWHSLELTDGDQWYFVVKAINGAGLESVGMSDGILIDSSAPFISSVRVTRDGAGNEEAAYVEPGTNLYLIVAAGDEQSGIDSFEVQYGTKQGDVFNRTTGSAVQNASVSPIALDSPLYQPTVDQAPLIYEVRAKNGATLAEVGYSAGLTFTAVRPVVSQVVVQQVADQLVLTWATNAGTLGAPVASSKVTIKNAVSGLVVSDPPRVNGTRLSLPLANFSDGSYKVEVKATSLAKLESDPVEVGFWIDSTAPAAPILAAPPAYVSSTLSLAVTASDPQSGLAEWSYRLGTQADPDQASGGWVSVVQSSNLSINQSWGAEVTDRSQLFLEVRVKNRAGLWSETARSAAMVVDKTPAVISGLAVKAVSRTILLENVRLEDAESGLNGYELTVHDALGQQIGSPTNVSAAGAKVLNLSNLTVNVGTLTHAGTYTLTIKAKNVSGAPVSQATSSSIHIDLNAPVLQYQNPGGWPSHNGGFVVNSLGVGLPYLVSDDVSSQLDLSGTVTSPSGIVTTVQRTGQSAGTTGTVAVTGSEFGVYTISLTAVDQAGNSSAAVVKTIRHNRAPLVVLGDATTTPGRVLTLSAQSSDPEGDSLAYLWDFGDGTAVSNLPSPTHAYHQKVAGGQTSEYALKLTVTDQFGASTVTVKTVRVSNTVSGTLFEDELWTGERVVTGVVRVPQGVKLTLASTARVRFQGNALDGYGQGLIVEGQLILASGAELTKATGQTSSWAGVLVKGQAQVTGALIRDAERGLTAVSGSVVTVTSSVLTGNEIGLHVLGNAQVNALNNQFTSNRVFAIKEDGGGRPSLSGNSFNGNRENYYQWDGGVLDLDEINDLTGNQGE